MELVVIAAVAENDVIGKQGGIPWNLPEDMKRFKSLTLNHPVIMGRKTYESLPAKVRPLPQRLNYVVSRTRSFINEGAFTACSLEDAVRRAHFRTPYREEIDYSRAYIIGGQQIYTDALKIADLLEITHVHRHIDGGDAFFPPIVQSEWQELVREEKESYSFVTYARK